MSDRIFPERLESACDLYDAAFPDAPWYIDEIPLGDDECADLLELCVEENRDIVKERFPDLYSPDHVMPVF